MLAMDLHAAPLLSPTTSGDAGLPSTSPSCLSVSSSQVTWHLEKLNLNKAAASDGVSLSVLKVCEDQLCGNLQHLLNLTLSQEKVLVL